MFLNAISNIGNDFLVQLGYLIYAIMLLSASARAWRPRTQDGRP